MKKKRVPYGRFLIGIAIGAGILYFLFRNTTGILPALQQAHPLYILLALIAMTATLLLKAWRWQHLYYPHTAPPLPTLFNAMMAGQLFNLVSPLRIGEIVRIWHIDRHTPHIKTRTLSTIVIEKSLDALFLALSALLVLPLVIVPSWVQQGLPTTLAFAFLLILILYILAYQSPTVIRLARWLFQYLPPTLTTRLDRLLITGLDSLSSLRHPRQNLRILSTTALIAFLGFIPPYCLFFAFDLPLNLLAAALIHIGLTIGLTPPTTPARVGVFEWLTTLILTWFNVNDQALALSYALTFHLVVILPQILFGLLPFLQYQQTPAPSPLKTTHYTGG